MNKKGIIVLGHGSKREEANDEVRELTAILKANDYEDNKDSLNSYATAFLAMAEPGLKEIVDDMYTQGLKQIVILPLFLTQGNHLKEDIPELLEEIKNEYSDLNLFLGKHLGADLDLAKILKNRILKAQKV